MNYQFYLKLPFKYFLLVGAIVLGVFGIKMSKQLGLKVATAVEVGKVL